MWVRARHCCWWGVAGLWVFGGEVVRPFGAVLAEEGSLLLLLSVGAILESSFR